jgi:uncharacterized integral membrane protein
MANGGQSGTAESSNVRRYVIIALLVILAIFVLQNSQKVKIDFLFFTTTETPLIVALLFAALLGAVIGWLATRIGRHND